jgi:hypothetical protein
MVMPPSICSRTPTRLLGFSVYNILCFNELYLYK